MGTQEVAGKELHQHLPWYGIVRDEWPPARKDESNQSKYECYPSLVSIVLAIADARPVKVEVVDGLPGASAYRVVRSHTDSVDLVLTDPPYGEEYLPDCGRQLSRFVGQDTVNRVG